MSIYEIIGNLSNTNYKKVPKEDFNEENLEYNLYLHKLTKYFNFIRKFVVKNKVKIELSYINYFFEIFVSNHVLIQEIHIVFKFLNSLLDFKRKWHYLTEESFSKVFYDILLRLDYESIDSVIYTTIESYIFYINIHLKILKYELNKIEMMEKNIIGYDFLFEIYLNTPRTTVKDLSCTCLLNIFKS